MELSLNKQMGFIFVSRMAAYAFVFLIPLVLARVFSLEEFGQYKQLFLVHETLWICLTLGLSGSLYYFIPHYPKEWRAYVCQTLLLLGCLGIIGAGSLVVFKSHVASFLNNPDLEPYLPYLAVYTGLSLLTTNLEYMMVILKQSRLVASTFIVSDFLRALFMIGAAVWTRSIYMLVLAALGWMMCRFLMLLLYLRTQGISLWVKPQRARLREQFFYAIPFGLADIVGAVADRLHQYVVSHMFNPAAFAIYAVGCFYIPVIEIVFSTISDVTLVRLAELRKAGQNEESVKVIGDAVVKMCLLLVPLYVWLMVNARNVIVLLFTERFEESVAIFQVFMAVVLLHAFQLDYVQRAFADTRFSFPLYILQLFLTGVFLALLIPPLGMLGAVVAYVVASGIIKVLIIVRVSVLLKVTLVRVLPWSQLGRIGLSSAGAGLIIWVVLSLMSGNHLIVQLMVSASMFAVVYTVCVWHFNGIEMEQKYWVMERLNQLYRTLVGAVTVAR